MYMYGRLWSRLDILLRDANKTALLIIDEHEDAVLPRRIETGNMMAALFSRSSLSITAYQQRLLMYMQRMDVPVWCIRQRSNTYGPLRTQLTALYNGKETILRKSEYNAFKNTELHADLQSQGIKNLIIMGWNANVCVAATIGVFNPRHSFENKDHGAGALQLGYKIFSCNEILHGDGTVAWSHHRSRMIEFFERL